MQGVQLEGTIVAIKQLSSESKQGTREFTNEIGIMLSLEHPNIVKLHGLCEEDDQMLLNTWKTTTLLMHYLVITFLCPSFIVVSVIIYNL